MKKPPQNGFFAFHANHLEDLRDVVVTVCKSAPLPPLSKELFLVQSNGIAQWLKLALAKGADKNGLGIAAGIDTSLPSSFIWTAYRAVLSANKVPESSPLDKANLAWRLYRLLPSLQLREDNALFAPLMQFLAGNNPALRRFQLAQRLADLYDQYQVYRADWLALWSQGDYSLIKANGTTTKLDESQIWQAKLWEIIRDDIGPELAKTSRATVHQTFLQACKTIDKPVNPHLLPKRIIVFGVTSMPKQMLEALHAISRFTQVVFCVVNPCQYYWGDIVSDRELFSAEQKRGLRSPKLAQIDVDELHQHANPLLASLGKQGRDYIRLLDTFDDTSAQHAAQLSDSAQIDIFRDYDAPSPQNKEQQSCSLLQDIQNDILHLTPIDEVLGQNRMLSPKAQHSIVFHQVHSPQREAEVLHDQLLAAFDRDKDLKPSDILVMMPDVNIYAPYIRAAFGLVQHNDPRHIPFTISDQGLRNQEPMIIAFEQLLNINTSRFTYSEVMSLLELPAISERFDISASDLSLLKSWIKGANIRWGLSPNQRKDVLNRDDISGNTWQEGLQSLLLGYSIGDEQVWEGIQAYPEVGGLQASLIGQLIDFIRTLETFARCVKGVQNITQWQAIIVAMLNDFFMPDGGKIDMLKSDILKQLDAIAKEFLSGDALNEQFDIDILAETLLSRLDKSTINHRFMIGKVNFATLMPMRAIPFKQVYLLGMNSGDYPRTASKVDFDLMAHDYRPGDRSVREDDRYLFLEAMLSARQSLYISWVGRSIKDDSEQPPSILIAQLQDYINKFYTSTVDVKNGDNPVPAVDLISTQHPLQAFSNKYFIEKEQVSTKAKDHVMHRRLFTYAKEWHNAMSLSSRDDTSTPESDSKIAYVAPAQALSIKDVSEFLMSPVASFYKKALDVKFEEFGEHDTDNETFLLNALDQSQLVQEVISELVLNTDSPAHFKERLSQHVHKVTKRGKLGIASTPSLLIEGLNDTSLHIFECYYPLLKRYDEAYENNVSVRYDFTSGAYANGTQIITLIDEISELRQSSASAPQMALANISIARHKTFDDKGMRYESFLPQWATHIAGNAMGNSFATYVVSKEESDIVHLPAMTQSAATNILDTMLAAYQQAMTQALPIEPRAAFAYLQNNDKIDDIHKAYEKSFQYDKGYLRKAFGNTSAFIHESAFKDLAKSLYGDLYEVLRSQ